MTFKAIPINDLQNMIGKRVHVSWAKPGCCWELKSFDEDTAILVTPRTRKEIAVKVSDLRYTRLHER